MSLKFLDSGHENGENKSVWAALLRNLFNRTTAVFTAISIVLCMFESVAGTSSMRASLFWWFLLFSAVLSIISLVADFMKSKNVHYVVVMITHFLLSYIAFFLIFIKGNLFNAYMMDAGNTQNSPFFVGLVYTLAFIGAYIIIFGLKFGWYILVDKLKKNKLS